MGDFRQSGGNRFGGGNRGGFGGRDGGRPNFPRKSWGGGDRDRGPVVMHPAVCDQCKQPCEVPFRPTDGKPIYCNACFGGKKDFGNNRDNRGGDRFPQKSGGFGNNSNRGGNDETKKQLEMLNTKMDQLIKAVNALSGSKPSTPEVKKEITKVVPAEKVKKTVKKVSKKK